MSRADEATRFKPGQSGNLKGKPKGSRQLRDLCSDFEANGLAAIERCRIERPDVIASWPVCCLSSSSSG